MIGKEINVGKHILQSGVQLNYQGRKTFDVNEVPFLRGSMRVTPEHHL